MIDAKLINFLSFENRLYKEAVGDQKEGFIEEVQDAVKNLIYDIANSKNFNFYRNNSFKKGGM